MTTIQNLTDKNIVEWNKFVLSNSATTPYHLTHWSKSIESAYGYKASGIIARDDSEKLTGIFPYIEFLNFFRKVSYCSLPYADLGGILSENESARTSIKNHLEKLYENDQVSDIEFREQGAFLTEEKIAELALSHSKVSMIMALSSSSTEQLKAFKPKLRSQIKKAAKNGLTCNTAQDDALIDDFYYVISKNMRDLGSPVHSKKLFREVMINYADYAFTCVIYKNDKPCAAGITLKTQTNACIPWASSLREFNRLAPNMLLYWKMISHLADSNIQKLDFGRSTINEGTFKFKKQWGARPAGLTWYKLGKEAEEQQAPKTSNLIRSLIEFCWKRLPLGITVRLGPKLRKHISL